MPVQEHAGKTAPIRMALTQGYPAPQGDTASPLWPRRGQSIPGGARLDFRIECQRGGQIGLACVGLSAADFRQAEAIARPRQMWLLRDGLLVGLDGFGIVSQSQLHQAETVEIVRIFSIAPDRLAAITQGILEHLVAQATCPA